MQSKPLLFPQPLDPATFVTGFTYLPLKAFVTRMDALIDLVHAWTALNAPAIAQPEGSVVPFAPYLYRARMTSGGDRRRRLSLD